MREQKIALILLLILCYAIVPISEIDMSKGQLSSIFIRSDGSIEGTTKIHVEGNQYTLTGNITVHDPLVDGIYVEKDNIVIDGSGYTLEGNGEGVGIHLYQRSGVAIMNFSIKNWYCGLSNPNSNCTIEGNLITECDIGINLAGTHNCTFIRNDLLNNRDDIFLTTGHSNKFSGNNIGKLVWSTAFLVPGENYFEGNYWGEYEGVDNNGDGFGDSPFMVYWVDYGEGNITCYDNHPLMEPSANNPLMESTANHEFILWIILSLFLLTALFVFLVFRKRLFR